MGKNVSRSLKEQGVQFRVRKELPESQYRDGLADHKVAYSLVGSGWFRKDYKQSEADYFVR